MSSSQFLSDIFLYALKALQYKMLKPQQSVEAKSKLLQTQTSEKSPFIQIIVSSHNQAQKSCTCNRVYALYPMLRSLSRKW